MPAARGHTPTAGEEFLPFLRSLADPAGRLPRWTDWWDEDDVAPMFTSQITLARRDGARHGLAPTSVLGMGPLAPGGGT